MNAGYEWTGDDAAFAGRVDAALTHLDIPAADLAEWRECCRRWGPRSRSALGCLLGFVRVAWGDPTIHVTHEGYEMVEVWNGASGALAVDRADTAKPLVFSEEADGPMTAYWSTEDTALVAALEAAPR